STVESWAQFRGPLGTGEAPDANPPVRWSETENVIWKTALKGLGHSSPVVWDNHIFLTTAVPVGEPFEPVPDNRPGSHDNLMVSSAHQYVVIAADRSTGEILWEKVVNENVPREGGHDTGSLASASPVTDGEFVYVSFGSHGTFCLDFEGSIIWQKEYEPMHSKHGHGEGISPALGGGLLAINRDQEDQSYLVVYEARTGDEKWKVEREEVTSWSTPIFVEHEGTMQLIVAGSNRIRGYDAETGDVIWECGGMSNNIVATPIHHQGVVYFASSYEIQAMLAIKLEGAEGDITDTPNVLWMKHERTPYVPSPLLYDDKLYFLRHYQGVISVLNVDDGSEDQTPVRLRGFHEIYASLVAADDRIYIVNRAGATFVISASEFPRPLSANVLEDSFSATPALVGNQIILRGEKFLYCLGETLGETEVPRETETGDR
ncbi:MAG: PQQ-binding-like beta-propeller repeat protein, partial [Planctomycetota bacterium]